MKGVLRQGRQGAVRQFPAALDPRGCVFLKPGELFLGLKPSCVTTVLGSCVAVSIFHPVSKTGALCHAMLPSRSHAAEGGEAAFRYLDEAVRHMLKRFEARGGARNSLIIKAFGGGDVLLAVEAAWGGATVGRRNIEGLFRVLERKELQMVAYDLGGTRARKIHFFTDTGQVFAKRLTPRSLGVEGAGSQQRLRPMQPNRGRR